MDKDWYEGYLHEGFWKGGSTSNDIYPSIDTARIDPTWELKDAFLKKLSQVEKNIVALGGHEVVYLGYSWCRFCNKTDNGDTEFSVPLFKVVWPQGYKHYIEKHDVVPSQKFIDMIMLANIQEHDDAKKKDAQSDDWGPYRVLRIMAGACGKEYTS